MTFASDTAVLPAGEDRWKGVIAPDWDIFGNANGGYMLSIAARASSLAAGNRRPVSVTGQYTRPCHTGPIDIDTHIVRHGRRFSVVRSTISQDDAVVLEVLGSFAEPELSLIHI